MSRKRVGSRRRKDSDQPRELDYHISRTDSTSETQLGINHLKIRDQYKNWTSIIKNLNRAYKKKVKNSTPYELIHVLAQHVIQDCFDEIYEKRKNMDSMPTASELEEDRDRYFESTLKVLKKKLKFKIKGEAMERQLSRVVNEGVFLVHCVVVVRPLATFVWEKVGVPYDELKHDVKNSKKEKEDLDLGNPDNQFIVNEIVYPGYNVSNDVFRKTGVVLKRMTIEDIISQQLITGLSEIEKSVTSVQSTFPLMASAFKSIDPEGEYLVKNKKVASIEKIIKKRGVMEYKDHRTMLDEQLGKVTEMMDRMVKVTEEIGMHMKELRVVEQKGYQFFMNSLEEVRNQHPDVFE